MKLIKKNFFLILLLIYFFTGAYYSLTNGISHDEFHEQRNWEFNISLVKNILFDNKINPEFIGYQDKYYGIGFQIISQPIQFFLSKFLIKFQEVDIYGAHLISKHFVVFSFYFLSGIFVYLIVSSLIKNKLFSIISTFLYLLYPYLFGHGLFNPKDIPFLTLWLACTYVSTKIFCNLTKEEAPKFYEIIFLSLLSSLLISIRISGVLIFLQYLATFTIFYTSQKINFIELTKIYYKKLFLFILSTIFITYILYPIFWKNPFLFFEALSYMSKHFNDVCTLTYGDCLKSKDLNPSYIPLWLSVKLPVIILIGLLLLPFTEKKIFSNKTNNITYGTLLFSAFFIPFFLILKRTHLYDELRQILFLVPIIFIVGVISLYVFSRKFFYILGFSTLLIFIVENIKINPYQYTWFNIPSRVMDLGKNFELDYWGLSGKDLAQKFSKLNDSELSKRPCLLASPLHLVKPFLDSKKYNCFGLWSEIDSNYERPFWAIQNVRNLKKGKSYKCSVIYQSKYNFLFSKKDIIMGKLIKCI